MGILVIDGRGFTRNTLKEAGSSEYDRIILTNKQDIYTDMLKFVRGRKIKKSTKNIIYFLLGVFIGIIIPIISDGYLNSFNSYLLALLITWNLKFRFRKINHFFKN